MLVGIPPYAPMTKGFKSYIYVKEQSFKYLGYLEFSLRMATASEVPDLGMDF